MITCLPGRILMRKILMIIMYCREMVYGVDGGLKPVKEDDVIAVRHKAYKAVQAVFKYLGLAEVTDEQVEAVMLMEVKTL